MFTAVFPLRGFLSQISNLLDQGKESGKMIKTALKKMTNL